MFVCLYNGCSVALDVGYVCADHRCETDCCMNVKKSGYDMCAQHINDDKKYKNEIFLLNRFDTTSRIIKPLTFQYENGSIVQSVLVQSFQYTCCVCYEEIDCEIYCCPNKHPLCGTCIENMKINNTNKNCPICRSPDRTRDFKTELIVSSILEPCKNDRCRYKTFPTKMSEHECRYSEINCFLCGKKTTPFDLQAHFETECGETFQEITNVHEFCEFVGKTSHGCKYYNLTEDNTIIYVKKCHITFKISIYVINIAGEMTVAIWFCFSKFIRSNKYKYKLKVMSISNLKNNLIFGTHVSNIGFVEWNTCNFGLTSIGYID